MSTKELGGHIFFEETAKAPEIVDKIPVYYITCRS